LNLQPAGKTSLQFEKERNCNARDCLFSMRQAAGVNLSPLRSALLPKPWRLALRQPLPDL
jgi:hypothetical protein